MARLVCIKGPLEGQTFEIGDGVTIGRGTHNAIPMPKDKKASRDHAKIWKSGATQYAVADLGSTNGTLVNDGKISRTDLKDEDEVQIGEAVFRFELGADEKPKPKVRERPAESGREDLAALLRGEATPDRPAAATGAAAIEIKSRILQYDKKRGRGHEKSVDLGQTAGAQRWGLIVLAIVVAVGLFFVVKSVLSGGEAKRPGARPESSN